MNFDRLNRAACVTDIPPVDERCSDSAYALAHPDQCSNAVLIIHPSLALICVNDSIVFRLFEYLNGVETEITDDITFSSSDLDVFVVGVNSGSGTALSGTGVAIGAVSITAAYGGKQVTASIEVLAGTGDTCCDEITVATAIAIDNSRSMSLGNKDGFGKTRLNYAKSVATAYGGLILNVGNAPKDSVKVWSFHSEPSEIMTAFSGVESEVVAAIAGITQTQQKTDLLDIFTTITDDLLAQTADKRVILLITDGEHTNDTNRQAILDAATTFKDAGGIVIVIGVRANGQGYDLLERIATGGYFLNATPNNIPETLTSLNYLKSLTCAGNCIPTGNEYTNEPQLDYSSFLNWTVFEGQVNLIGPGLLDLLPGNGLYVDMASGSKAHIRSIDSFHVLTGRNYRISFNAAGNQRLPVAGQGLKFYVREVGANDTDPNLFEQTIYPAWTDEFQSYSTVFPALFETDVRLYFQQLGTASDPQAGNLLDAVLFQDFSTQTIILDDDFDDENLVFVDPACGPSSAVAAIEDPAEPTDSAYDAPGSSIRNGQEYSYAISYLTPEGETALSPVNSVTTAVAADVGIRVSFAAPPANVISVRIWRNIVTTGTDYWLLASVNPEHYTSYDDSETHAQFADPDRVDYSIFPPSSNTTGKNTGELGLGYADCCYYFTTVVTDDELISAIPAMTSETTPSGIVTSNSIDPTPNYYGFDGDVETLWRGNGSVNGDGYTFTVPVWLAYEFPAAIIIRRYSISHNDAFGGLLPRDWEFQGSNDGSSWTVLDTQAGVIWATPDVQTYNIGSPASYLHYRIVVLKTQPPGGPPAPDAWAYIGELKMFTSTTNIITEYVNNCPECADQTPGVQPQDTGTGLGDIETPFTPPPVNTATAQYTATCEDDEVNLSTTPLEWATVSSALGPPVTNVVQLTAGAATLAYYRVGGFANFSNMSDWLFQGSNDGTTWTTLDSQTGLVFYAGEYKRFLLTGNAAYSYYRLYVTVSSIVGLTVPFVLFASPVNGGSFFAAAPTSVTEERTVTREGTYQAAYDEALAAATLAAQAQLNCAHVWTETVSVVASCPVGQFGNQVTRSATKSSLVSQADAIFLATAAAQTAADLALDCTLSNNTSQTVINAIGKATPYPGVVYIEGLGASITDVNVTLTGFTHGSPDDLIILLVAPDGVTNCLLMANCGGAAPQGISNVNLVLDQAAGAALPDTTQIVSGTFRPGIYGSVGGPGLLPAPAPQVATYGASLNVFNTLNPNGSWALYILDDLAVFGGTLNSWSLSITAV